ncbi:bacteriocin immunity protein [Lactiplantibacillus plantarum]|uniref:bacteriocin immunity protein n=1 Tax=Lactiplantibacillus plantarum TaxID=1590 RepID=UPI00338E6512
MLYSWHGGINVNKNYKAKRLMQQIDVAYNDPEVKQDAQVRADLLRYAMELDKNGNYLLIATKVNGMAMRVMRDHMHQPLQAINTLYTQTARTSEYYWGVAAASIFSGLW